MDVSWRWFLFESNISSNEINLLKCFNKKHPYCNYLSPLFFVVCWALSVGNLTRSQCWLPWFSSRICLWNVESVDMLVWGRSHSKFPTCSAWALTLLSRWKQWNRRNGRKWKMPSAEQLGCSRNFKRPRQPGGHTLGESGISTQG